MSIIKFETGQTVNFDGNPTPEDIEEVARSLGVKKSSTTLTPASPKKDLLQKTTDIVGSIFPGKQVGQAIGTLAGLGISKFQGTSKQYDTSTPSLLQVGGDIAQGALTIASGGAGRATSALWRVGLNAALGAGIGGTGAIAEGKGAKDVAKSTALGGAIGGGVSGIAEISGSLINNLPKWFAKSALPKAADGTIDYALSNKVKIGSTKTLLNNSDNAVQMYSNKIQTILKNPQYANNIGDGSASIQGVLEAFPDSKLNSNKVIKIIDSVVKGSAKLVEKVAKGTATLAEKNQLRSALDIATKKVFTDSPTLTFNKQVAHALANTLRNEVQSIAPETAPIFQNFSKELELNKILTKLVDKKNLKPTWQDVASTYAGYQVGGVKGAIGALVGERLLGSTGAKLATGKIIQNVAKKTTPALNVISQATRAPLIKNLNR